MPSLGSEIAAGLSEREARWRRYLHDIAKGDSEGLAKLYDESAGTLMGLALRMIRNQEDAEEILSDVYEQVWRSARTFDSSRGSAWRWLTLLVRSRTLDRLRTVSAKRDRDTLTIDNDWEISGYDPLPDEASIFRQEQAIISRAISLLPVDQKLALELAFFSGLTHVEIAGKLGVPLGTIKTRIRAAMDKLRISLTEGGLAAAGRVQ